LLFSELDDGAYNPLWTMRGFTQTFHFWKETRRAQSVPLNAFLTYITLPWWSIAKGIVRYVLSHTYLCSKIFLQWKLCKMEMSVLENFSSPVTVQ